MTEPQTGPAQVRCTDMEDYARIFNDGFNEATEQLAGELALARVRADALREAAAEQRRLAEDARTNNGEAEHTDIADWLEERADQLADRPMPTQEQIAAAIHDAHMMHSWGTHLCAAFACFTRYSTQADAVLALLKGGHL